jgi:hypothetical protein
MPTREEREDDATGTPPHGDTLRDRAPNEAGAPESRHGVQLDPRGEPDGRSPSDASRASSAARRADREPR